VRVKVWKGGSLSLSAVYLMIKRARGISLHAPRGRRWLLHGDAEGECHDSLTNKVEEAASSSGTDGSNTTVSAGLSVDDEDKEGPDGSSNSINEGKEVENLTMRDLITTEGAHKYKDDGDEEEESVEGANGDGLTSGVDESSKAGVLNDDTDDSKSNTHEANLGKNGGDWAGISVAVVLRLTTVRVRIRSTSISRRSIRRSGLSRDSCTASGLCGSRTFVHNVVGCHFFL